MSQFTDAKREDVSRLVGGADYLTLPGTDTYIQGPATRAFNAGATITAGQAVILDSSSTWQLTDANTASLRNGYKGIAAHGASSGEALVVALPGSILYHTSFATLTVGTPYYLSETAGAITSTAGNVTSGSSGDAGTFVAFPATAANGTMILAAGNAGGAFNTTITSGTIGQSTVYTVPDIGASTGGVVVSTAAVRMKSVAGAAAAGGAAAQSFTDAFCTSGSNVVGNWNTQANAASVLKIVPGNGSFVVTSSADAGVGTFNYVIMK